MESTVQLRVPHFKKAGQFEESRLFTQVWEKSRLVTSRIDRPWEIRTLASHRLLIICSMVYRFRGISASLHCSQRWNTLQRWISFWGQVSRHLEERDEGNDVDRYYYRSQEGLGDLSGLHEDQGKFKESEKLTRGRETWTRITITWRRWSCCCLSITPSGYWRVRRLWNECTGARQNGTAILTFFWLDSKLSYREQKYGKCKYWCIGYSNKCSVVLKLSQFS